MSTETTQTMNVSASEQRLAILTCSMAGQSAAELLELLAPERVEPVQQVAEDFRTFDRKERLSAFAQGFSPPPLESAVRRLARALESEPSWFAAAVCQSVTPDVRERLLRRSALRKAWGAPSTPHPALLEHARRFACRFLFG